MFRNCFSISVEGLAKAGSAIAGQSYNQIFGALALELGHTNFKSFSSGITANW
jgi:hypothetical protein